MSYHVVSDQGQTLGFSLRPPKWLRKSKPLKFLKKAAILNLKAGAIAAGVIAGGAALPLIARGAMLAAPGLLRRGASKAVDLAAAQALEPIAPDVAVRSFPQSQQVAMPYTQSQQVTSSSAMPQNSETPEVPEAPGASAQNPTKPMPSWIVPAGIAVLALMFMGKGKRTA